MTRTPSGLPSELAQRVDALREFVDGFPSQKAAAEALGVDSSHFSKAFNPKTTSDGRLASLEGKVALWQSQSPQSTEGQRATLLSRRSLPPVTDMLDDPERKRQPGPDGLTRAASSFVAEGHDADGLMYAVELTVYLRTSPRVTQHHHGARPAATTTDG